MEYKGYLGSVEFSEEDEMFFGKGLGIRSLISYEGDNVKDLISVFHDAVSLYSSKRNREVHTSCIVEEISWRSGGSYQWGQAVS